jgi:L-threonylcarbamoyladenylate synthase
MNNPTSRQNEAPLQNGAQHQDDGTRAVVKTRRLDSSADDIAVAASILRAGGLVAFPTETVYGLGADAANAHAVAGIYTAKGRPRFNPLIAHVADFTAAERLGIFDARAKLLAQAFWPGPLTLVVRAAPDCDVCELARAGQDTIAIRVPTHPVALAFIKAFGGAIVAPSANISGGVSPTQAAHVLADLDQRIEAVIDGGNTDVGVESTILACLDDEVRMLRPGGVPREAIEAVLRVHLSAPLPSDEAEITPLSAGLMSPGLMSAGLLSPGLLASHYAPRAAVRLNAHDVRQGEAWLGFGTYEPIGFANAIASRNLSASGDLAEAATHLFGDLRYLDKSGATTIAVAPIPNFGLGEALIDRLSRAAAPRAPLNLDVQSQ